MMDTKLFLPGLIRVQELIATGQKVAAHTGFHVHRAGEDRLRFGNDLVGMAHPAGRVAQELDVRFVEDERVRMISRDGGQAPTYAPERGPAQR